MVMDGDEVMCMTKKDMKNAGIAVIYAPLNWQNNRAIIEKKNLEEHLECMEIKNPSRSLKGKVYLCGVNPITNQKIENEYKAVMPYTHQSDENYIGED